MESELYAGYSTTGNYTTTIWRTATLLDDMNNKFEIEFNLIY